MMMKTTVALLASLALAACGGGGDDGGDAPAATIVSETTAHSEADSANRSRNDVLVAYQSSRSATGYTGDIRYQACVKGTWRQTLKADATLRLSLSVYGRQVAVIDNIAGKRGTDNVITFRGCAETFTKAAQLHYPQGSVTIKVQAVTNRQAFPVDGFDASIDWTVELMPR